MPVTIRAGDSLRLPSAATALLPASFTPSDPSTTRGSLLALAPLSQFHGNSWHGGCAVVDTCEVDSYLDSLLGETDNNNSNNNNNNSNSNNNSNNSNNSSGNANPGTDSSSVSKSKSRNAGGGASVAAAMETAAGVSCAAWLRGGGGADEAARVALGTDVGDVVIWLPRGKGSAQGMARFHHGGVTGITSTEGKGPAGLASCAADGSVALWDLEKKTVSCAYEGHSGPDAASAFIAAVGDHFATGGDAGIVALWDAAGRSQGATARIALPGGTNSGTRPAITCGAAITSCGLVAVGTENGGLHILDPRRPGAWVHRLERVHGSGLALTSVAEIPSRNDGDKGSGRWRIVSGSVDESVAVTGAAAGGGEVSVDGHHPGFGSEVSAVGAAPGGKGHALVACRDATLRGIAIQG